MTPDSARNAADDSDDLARDTESPRGEWGGPPADSGATEADAAASTDAEPSRGSRAGAEGDDDVAIVADTDAYASTEPLAAADQSPPVERASTGGSVHSDRAGDDHAVTDADAEADTNRGGATSREGRDDQGGAGEPPREGGAGEPPREAASAARTGSTPDAGDVAIVSDTDSYASTEPLLASDTEAGTPHGDDAGRGDATVREAGVDRDGASHRDGSDREDEPGSEAHAPAETGAAVAQPSDSEQDATAADRAAEPAEERYDPTPTSDWAADEGALLEESHDRGDRLARDREELAGQSGAPAAGGDAASADTASGRPSSDASDASDDAGPAARSGGATAYDQSGDTASAGSVDQAAGRRVSDFHELRDGGFGVGSAAPLDDRAQPLDHPVQGYRESMTFRAPGDAAYDSAEPDVWFYDEAAAERHGFRRSDG